MSRCSMLLTSRPITRNLAFGRRTPLGQPKQKNNQEYSKFRSLRLVALQDFVQQLASREAKSDITME
jgi:hypothetical protein